MEGPLVSDALLSSFVQVVFNKLASPKVLDFFHARKLDEKLLKELNMTLLSIDALADDAELKQFSDPLVKAWLVLVRDVLFDVEDLLSEIDYELIKSHVEAEFELQTFTHKVSSFFNTNFRLFNKKIVSEMKQVLKKIQYLESQKDVLGLEKATRASVGSGSKKLRTSLMNQSVIYGRDEDREMIINWLTSDSHNQLSILSVVGMGGVGKTTLVQLVYNDPRMEEADFVIKAWVCVSDDFDVLRLTKAILETITKSKYDSETLEMIRERLKEELAGKRFLLVLDDVWNERNEEWEAVKTPLKYGARGSRILVTTRSEKVASTMGSSKVHYLRKLEDDHCWQVFAKYAFQHDNPQLNARLKEIATEIVKRCNGLPLALKSMGSLLRTKSSVSEWENVLISNPWNSSTGDIEIFLHALLLSYHYLPSHLKRCFFYCALFPQNYEFNKECLIQFWIAQNFLQGPQQSSSPEEVCEQYFDDLVSRSFFQQSSRDKTLFVMHDLLYDLAYYLFGDICFRLGVDEAKSVPKTARYFSIARNYKEHFDVLESLPDAKRLRTFFPTTGRGIFEIVPWECKIPIHELFSKFKHLHVLSLSCCSDLTEVPDSLGKLKHLHSLDLSSTSIKKLPDSTCLLYNLQILKLNFCESLEELPMKLYKLVNLRCLEFIGTGVSRMPMHFGKLKNLQVVNLFYAGKGGEFSIRQLEGHNIHGWLSIKELQNIEDPLDALAVGLINKTRLEELGLEWNREHILEDPRKDKEVLENLQPSKYLKDLSIENYGGIQLASWLSNNSLWNVVSLRLMNCRYCVCLPSLGFLPSLKELWITGFDGIVSIGAEFYGSSFSPFPSLEKLYFEYMKHWEEWECNVTFPRFQSLRIYACPKLKGLSEQVLHVKKLYISYCERVTIREPSLKALSLESIEHTVSNSYLEDFSVYYCSNLDILTRLCFDFLVTLKINRSCDPLKTFPLDFFPKLCSLKLWNCCNLRMISQERTHDHLKTLEVSGCPQFESFPKAMHILLPSLSELRIFDCPKLAELSYHLLHSDEHGMEPSYLEELIVEGCTNINIPMTLCYNFLVKLVITNSCDSLMTFPLDFFPNLCSLDFYGCCNLQMISQKNTHIHLKDLKIWECPQLESFPSEGLSAPRLVSFSIGGLENLKSLPKSMHILLPSLVELQIEDCPQMDMFSDGGLPSNLKELQLSSCSKLIPSMKVALEANTSIEILTIENLDVESFPEGFLPLYLTSLQIWNCPSLQCLPKEGLPKSISTLEISRCPLLEQRCQQPDGEDWGKIAHIQNLKIL